MPALLGGCAAPGSVGPTESALWSAPQGGEVRLRSRLQPVTGRSAFSAAWSANAAAAGEAAKVDQTIAAIVGGLEAKDARRLAPLYVADDAATFFSPVQLTREQSLPGPLARAGHLAMLDSCLANFSAVKIVPDGSGTVRMGDGLALWTGTGTNLITFSNGQSAKTAWRWTMMLERDPEGRWLVTHEHSSFEPLAK
jgi:ketosteroid isomerase-like protein